VYLDLPTSVFDVFEMGNLMLFEGHTDRLLAENVYRPLTVTDTFVGYAVGNPGNKGPSWLGWQPLPAPLSRDAGP